MKPSYFQSPRTLDESTFYSWADPIMKPETTHVPAYNKVLYVLAAIAILVIWMTK